MNRQHYANPTSDLPGKDTILAAIVCNMSDGYEATTTEICNVLGKNPRSMRALISTAESRNYIQCTRPPHSQPQKYRLTAVGRLVKAELARA